MEEGILEGSSEGSSESNRSNNSAGMATFGRTPPVSDDDIENTEKPECQPSNHVHANEQSLPTPSNDILLQTLKPLPDTKIVMESETCFGVLPSAQSPHIQPSLSSTNNESIDVIANNNKNNNNDSSKDNTEENCESPELFADANTPVGCTPSPVPQTSPRSSSVEWSSEPDRLQQSAVSPSPSNVSLQGTVVHIPVHERLPSHTVSQCTSFQIDRSSVVPTITGFLSPTHRPSSAEGPPLIILSPLPSNISPTPPVADSQSATSLESVPPLISESPTPSLMKLSSNPSSPRSPVNNSPEPCVQNNPTPENTGSKDQKLTSLSGSAPNLLLERVNPGRVVLPPIPGHLLQGKDGSSGSKDSLASFNSSSSTSLDPRYSRRTRQARTGSLTSLDSEQRKRRSRRRVPELEQRLSQTGLANLATLPEN